MLYEEWKSRYKNLKNFNTVLQRCPRFWPLAPPRGMNPGVYSLGISEDPPRYLSSKFDASVRSDCWDISIWKTLTQTQTWTTGVTTIALLVLRTGELKIGILIHLLYIYYTFMHCVLGPNQSQKKLALPSLFSELAMSWQCCTVEFTMSFSLSMISVLSVSTYIASLSRPPNTAGICTSHASCILKHKTS